MMTKLFFATPRWQSLNVILHHGIFNIFRHQVKSRVDYNTPGWITIPWSEQNLNALNVFDKTSFHERMGVHIVRTDSAAQDRCKFEAQTRKGRNQRQAHGMPLHH